MVEPTEIKSLLVQFKKAIVKKGLVSAGNFPITSRQLSKRAITIKLVSLPDYPYDCEIKNLDHVMTGLLVARDKEFVRRDIAERKYKQLEHAVNVLIARKGTYGDKHNEADCKYKQIVGSSAFNTCTKAVGIVRTELTSTKSSCSVRLFF